MSVLEMVNNGKKMPFAYELAKNADQYWSKKAEALQTARDWAADRLEPKLRKASEQGKIYAYAKVSENDVNVQALLYVLTNMYGYSVYEESSRTFMPDGSVQWRLKIMW